MPGVRHLDILSAPPVIGPANCDRLDVDLSGNLVLSTKGGQFTQIGGVSGDEEAMAKARAQAFLGPGFASYWNDYLTAPTDFTDSVQTGNWSAQVYGMPSIAQGMSGGSQVRYRSNGATGFHFQTFGTETTQPGILTSNQTWNPWYLETGVQFLTAPTGSCEMGVIGMYVPESPMTNTDGTGGAYMSLLVNGVTSLTTLTLRVWDGTTLTLTPTSIPIEVGLNIYRRFALVNDGLGTLWILRDGVVMTSMSVFPNATYLPGAPFVHERANGGTTDIVRDYIFAAGMRY